MSIEGAIAGLVLFLQPVTDGNFTKKIYQGIIYTGKIIKKRNKALGKHLGMKRAIS